MNTGSVLIADDLKEYLLIAKTFMAQRGFEVLTAENGSRALALARARQPRLILLDLMMPEMDGTEACAGMRREPSLAFTPIIIMSATGSREIRERCLQAGCTNFVVKPEKPHDLLNILANVLSVRERKVTRMTVIFSEAAPMAGRQMIGMAGNLSGTGMLLLSDKVVRAGSLLDLEFVVPKSNHTVGVQGKVLRVNQNTQGTYGAGVHFMGLSEPDQQKILAFITS